MKMKILLLATLTVIVAFIACKKNNVDITYNPLQTVTGKVIGRVINEAGEPVSGVAITAGISSTTTNLNGEFSFEAATLAENAAFVTAEKAGYFKGSRTFKMRANQKHFVEIMLLAKTVIGTISGTTGGSITITATGPSKDLSIAWADSSIIDKATGTKYLGAVSVAVNFIDPTNANVTRQMPGDLRGINESGKENLLNSYGMMAVELTGAAGEKLQIAPGKQATLKFPIPTSILGSAPATIALWSFNDSTGLWKQEGTATKSGNVYIGNVSHFSYWNCDYPFTDAAEFSAVFVNQGAIPFQYAHVSITRVNGYYTGAHGATDSAGYISGRVPANEPLYLDIYTGGYGCQTSVYRQIIGPFVTGTVNTLGTIVINNVSTSITVSGSVVGCNNTPLSSGFVVIKSGYSYYRAAISNGSYSLTYPACGSAQAISYFAVDTAAGKQSSELTATVQPGQNPLSKLTACTVSINEFINFTFNGTPYSLIAPGDSLSAYLIRNPIAAPRTSVYGDALGTTSKSMSFAFGDSAIGKVPLNYVGLNVQPQQYYTYPYASSPSDSLTITEYGAAGSGFIAGSFSTSVSADSGITTKPVQCTFRVRRLQ